LLIPLAAAGFISAEEALAAAQTEAVPAAIAGIFDLLPAEQALAVRITWATMTEVYRQDPLIQAIVTAGFATAGQVDGSCPTAWRRSALGLELRIPKLRRGS
jgi:hypothetical protein